MLVNNKGNKMLGIPTSNLRKLKGYNKRKIGSANIFPSDRCFTWIVVFLLTLSLITIIMPIILIKLKQGL